MSGENATNIPYLLPNPDKSWMHNDAQIVLTIFNLIFNAWIVRRVGVTEPLANVNYGICRMHYPSAQLVSILPLFSEVDHWRADLC